MDVSTRDAARNEARRNVRALTNETLAHHLIMSAEGSRDYDAVDRFALHYVAAVRLRVAS
jgi:hypothetical protein